MGEEQQEVQTSPFALYAYLERIGYQGTVNPSADVLDELHQTHLAAIPFENLDILLGKTIRLELEPLQEKMVARRRGGYCFEHNTLFRAALEQIGFDATSLAARVRAGATVIRPRTHMLLRVDLPGGALLADVGFGGDGLLRPLPLEAGAERWVGAVGHRLKRDGELWVLEGNLTGVWTELYAFTLEPQYPVDFEMANHFTSTYPRSPFVQNLTVQRSWPERRLILRNRELVVREGKTAETLSVRDAAHLLEVLDVEFGLSFPTGTRFAKPEFEDVS